jgi:uncharacterized membrane protein (UPF0127 family)
LQIRRALALVALLVACGSRAGPLARIHTAGGTVEVALEVADTPETRTRGLMYRTTLPDGSGMLFVFDEESNHEFWMKNTLIPLDMIFIAADGAIVGVAADTIPLSTAGVGVGRRSRFVLEVPGGWAARHGVKTGDRVELVGVRLP